MIRKLFLLLVLSTVAVQTLQAFPAWATDTTEKTISSNMEGFAFASSACCESVSSELQGKIITYEDGAWNLSQQNGIITVDSTNYNLQFSPTGQLNIQTPRDDCASGTIYTQNGEITLAGSDGTTLKGQGTYSWGNTIDCSGNTYSFTNLSGKIQDSSGQTSEFFTGTDSSPEIQ